MRGVSLTLSLGLPALALLAWAENRCNGPDRDLFGLVALDLLTLP